MNRAEPVAAEPSLLLRLVIKSLSYNMWLGFALRSPILLQVTKAQPQEHCTECCWGDQAAHGNRVRPHPLDPAFC